MTDIGAIFGDNVRRFRILSGFSQQDLALKAGLHRTYLSGVETGVRNPTLGIISRLAKALSKTEAELLTKDHEGY